MATTWGKKEDERAGAHRPFWRYDSMTRRTLTGPQVMFLAPSGDEALNTRPLEAMGGRSKNSYFGHCIYGRKWLISHSVFYILSFIWEIYFKFWGTQRISFGFLCLLSIINLAGYSTCFFVDILSNLIELFFSIHQWAVCFLKAFVQLEIIYVNLNKERT